MFLHMFRMSKTYFFLISGGKWQKRRKILTPTFHFSILRKFCDVMIENSEILIQDLKKECGREKTNIISYMTESTLKTICGK